MPVEIPTHLTPVRRSGTFHPTNMTELTRLIQQHASGGGRFGLVSQPGASTETVVNVFLLWLEAQAGGRPYEPSDRVTISLTGPLSVLVQPAKLHVTL